MWLFASADFSVVGLWLTRVRCMHWLMRFACRGQYISFAEATAILKNELKFPEERAIHFVKRFDHNKDGRLSAGEFTQFKKRIEDTYAYDHLYQSINH